MNLENLFEEAKKGIEIDEEKIKDTKSLLSLDINKPHQNLIYLFKQKKEKLFLVSNNQKKYFKF